MGYQFVRVEVFARSAPKKAKDRRCRVRDIIAECEREPGNHPHIAQPQPPVVLHGIRPRDLEHEVMAAAEAARDPKGRRLRQDAPILLAGVTSYPVPQADMSDEDRTAYAAWEADTVEWLRRTYGDRLRSVVRHSDETHLHLHHFATVDLAAGERIEVVHPGRQAMADARAGGCRSKKELDQAYRAAMRELQQRYHDEVGARHGMTRHGPRRRRLSRVAWRQEQAHARAATAIVVERDRLREENAALRHLLDRVTRQAQAVVAALLDPTKALPSIRPTWLPESPWRAIGQRVRAMVGVRAMQRSTRQAAIEQPDRPALTRS